MHWSRILHAATATYYAKQWTSMVETYGEEYLDVLAYLTDQWLRPHFEADLVAYQVNTKLHFGLVTISSAEGAHHALKKTGRLDLYNAFLRVICKLDGQHDE